MKNLLIGLVLGVVIGFAGSKLVFNDGSLESQNKAESLSDKKSSASREVDSKSGGIKTKRKMVNETSIASLSKNASAQPQTIEEYQAAYAALQQAVIHQNKAVQKLTAENKKLTESVKESGGRRIELADLSASDIETAKENIQASIAEAPEEYAEVLKSALESYNAGDALPDADALLRHYADEPDFAWSDVARAYIQNYFAAQADSNIQLVQLNCRKTYCEVYGFYSDGEKLDNPRQAGSQIQSAFNALEQAPGFSNLFVGLESASISIDSENSYMTFHNFIRSNRQ